MKRYRYPGIQPFATDQEDIFFGREQDIEQLRLLIELQKLVVLYAKSGIGKSSMINAGLIPQLKRKESLEPTTIRFLGWDSHLGETDQTPKRIFLDQVEGLRASKSYLDPLIPGESSLWYYFKTLHHKGGTEKIQLLIFDQFEELFTYPPEEVTQFARELKELIAEEIPERWKKALEKQYEEGHVSLSDQEIDELYRPLPIKLLFVVRSDKLGSLLGIQGQFPNVLRYIYHLEPLSREKAQAAIIRPALLPADLFISQKFEYEPAAIDKIFDFLSPGGSSNITSFQLQIICRDLESKIINSGKSRVTAEDIREIEKIFQEFYHSRLDQLGVEDRLAAQILLEEGLVFAEEERRLSIHQEAIIKTYNISQEGLTQLISSGLLRRDPSEKGGYRYELSHDTLIAPVLHSKSIRLAKEAQIKAIKEERKKRWRLLWVMLLVVLVAVGASLLGLFSYQQSQRVKKTLRSAENLALAYRTTDKTLAARVAEYAYLNDPENPAVKQAYMRLTHDTTLVPYSRYLVGQSINARFSKKGKLLLAGIGNVYEYDFPYGAVNLEYEGVLPSKFQSKIAFSDDAEVCVTGGYEGNEVYLFNFLTRRGKRIQPKFKGDFISNVAISSNKDRILITYVDEGTIVINLDGEVLHAHKGETGDTRFASFSRNGDYYLNVRMEGDLSGENLFVHNKDGELLKELNFKKVYSAAFFPDEDLICVGFFEGNVGIYRLEDGERVGGFKTRQRGPIIFISDTGSNIATVGDYDGEYAIKIWSAKGELRHTLKGHSNRVQSVLFYPLQFMLASIGHDKTMKVWDLSFWQSANQLNPVFRKKMGYKTFQMGSRKDSLFLVDENSGLRPFFNTTEGQILDFAFAPGAQKLAVALSDGTLRILDNKGREQLRMKVSQVKALAYSADGSLIATGYSNGSVWLWDGDGKHLKTIQAFNAPNNTVNEIEISSSKKYIATAGIEGSERAIRLWNVEGQLQHNFIGHYTTVDFMRFSRDENRLLSKDIGGTVKVWSIRQGNFEFSPRGRYKTTGFFPLNENELEVTAFDGTSYLLPIIPIHMFPRQQLYDSGVKLEPGHMKGIIENSDAIRTSGN